jgi:hypothetical protein
MVYGMFPRRPVDDFIFPQATAGKVLLFSESAMIQAPDS